MDLCEWRLVVCTQYSGRGIQLLHSPAAEVLAFSCSVIYGRRGVLNVAPNGPEVNDYNTPYAHRLQKNYFSPGDGIYIKDMLH
jgi:hypothetical protein